MASPATSTEDRIATASRSPLIWVMGVNAAMLHFGLRNEQVHEARDQYLLEFGAQAVVDAKQSQRAGRLRRKVVNAERRYPGISARFQADTLQAIGDDFNLSRQRVHALLGNLRLFAKLTGKSLEAASRAVTTEGRKRA